MLAVGVAETQALSAEMTEPSPQLSPQTTHLPPLVGLSLEELDSDGDLGNGDGNGSPSAKSDQSLISGAIPLKKLPAIGADTLHPGIRLISVLGMLSPTALWKQWRRAPDIIIPKGAILLFMWSAVTVLSKDSG